MSSSASFLDGLHNFSGELESIKDNCIAEDEECLSALEVQKLQPEECNAAAELTRSRILDLGQRMETFVEAEKNVEPLVLYVNGRKSSKRSTVTPYGLITPENTPPAGHNGKYADIQAVSPTSAPRKLKFVATRSKVPKKDIGLGITIEEKSIWSVPSSEEDEPSPKRVKLGETIIVDLTQDSTSSEFIRSPAPSPTRSQSPRHYLLEVSSAESSPDPEEECIAYASSSGDEYEAPVSKKKRHSSSDAASPALSSTKVRMGDLIKKPTVALPYSRHGVTYEVWARRQYAGEKLLKFSVNVIHVRNEDGEVSVWNDENSRRSFYLVRECDGGVFAPRIGHKCQIKTHPEFVFGADDISGVQYNPKDALVCLTKRSEVVLRSAYPDVMIVLGAREDMYNFLAVLRVQFDTSLESRKKQIFENPSLRLPKKWLA